MTALAPSRVHLISHANPPGKDIDKLGFRGPEDYLAFIRGALPEPLKLTATEEILTAVEDMERGGRVDDAVRIKDLQNAIDDPNTLAIVATNGGAYFSRIIPKLDFAPLERRTTPIWTFGFSEMTTLVNIFASYEMGRGVYWLCPHFVAWHLSPAAVARDGFAEFWRNLPRFLAGERVEDGLLRYGAIRGEVATGVVRGGSVRLIGGCISVLVAMLAGPIGARLRPEGRWLFIEDWKEEPYRLDRYLAALQFAGWFDKVAGVIVGDFHTKDGDTQRAVVELLKLYAPGRGELPVITTREIGHTWPMLPVFVNQPVEMRVEGKAVTIARMS